VPYDGSAASNKALSSAFEIAKMSEESERIRKRKGVISIILLHVIPKIPVPPTYVGSPLRRLSERTGESITIREYLKEVYQEMKASGVKMLDQKIREDKKENMNIQPKVTFGPLLIR
jgi:hypothetical protein